MTTYVRSLVSKQKRRFHEDGYNLDLTYITDNIIAMGYPAEKMEGMYRNNMADVVKFLDTRHPDSYKVYNLCSERTYDKAKFHGRVAHYPFEDHNAPPIELMQPFCEDVYNWLAQGKQQSDGSSTHVAVVHCKAGKGRTGVMICAYLLHAKMWKTPEEALKFYGAARTKNSKGVTIPSQSRYVGYYNQIINGKQYLPHALLLSKVVMKTIPHFNKDTGCNAVMDIKMNNIKIFSSAKRSETIRDSNSIIIKLLRPVPLCGDVKIEFHHKQSLSKEKMCHFWFNTSFIPSSNTLTLSKFEIDKAHKDKHNKIFDSDFSITLYFNDPHSNLSNNGNKIKNSNSNSSEQDENECSDVEQTYNGDRENKKSVTSLTIASEDDEEDSFENDIGDEEEEHQD